MVILVPTWDLALRIFKEACRLCYRIELRPDAVRKDVHMSTCLQELGQGCDILITIPRRLVDLMSQSRRSRNESGEVSPVKVFMRKVWTGGGTDFPRPSFRLLVALSSASRGVSVRTSAHWL